MPTTLGDVTPEERRAIVRDLLNVDLSLEDIVEKYGIGSKVIYLIANRAHLDMQRRNRIIRLKAKQRDMTRIIQLEIDLLVSQTDRR